jgi:hypothetical protein
MKVTIESDSLGTLLREFPMPAAWNNRQPPGALVTFGAEVANAIYFLAAASQGMNRSLSLRVVVEP